MDNNQVLERFIRDGWAAGLTSYQIKQDLIARHWEPHVIQATIDGLVRERVRQQEGQLTAHAGPDLWAHPTWVSDVPQDDAPDTPAPFANPCASQTPNYCATLDIDKNTSNTDKNIDQSVNNTFAQNDETPENFATLAPSAPAPQPPHHSPDVHLSRSQRLAQSPTRLDLSVTIPVPAAHPTAFATRAASALASAQNPPSWRHLSRLTHRDTPEAAAQKDLITQAHAFKLLFCLVGVIILALIWRFFVIK